MQPLFSSYGLQPTAYSLYTPPPFPPHTGTTRMDWLISTAAAQATGGTGSAQNSIVGMLPLLLIFVVFYFMLIRPQNKKAKEHRAMVATLETGAEIATAGGIVGKVTEVGENFLTVEIANNVLVKVQRNTISQVLPKGTLKSS